MSSTAVVTPMAPLHPHSATTTLDDTSPDNAHFSSQRERKYFRSSCKSECAYSSPIASTQESTSPRRKPASFVSRRTRHTSIGHFYNGVLEDKPESNSPFNPPTSPAPSSDSLNASSRNDLTLKQAAKQLNLDQNNNSKKNVPPEPSEGCPVTGKNSSLEDTPPYTSSDNVNEDDAADDDCDDPAPHTVIEVSAVIDSAPLISKSGSASVEVKRRYSKAGHGTMATFQSDSYQPLDEHHEQVHRPRTTPPSVHSCHTPTNIRKETWLNPLAKTRSLVGSLRRSIQKQRRKHSPRLLGRSPRNQPPIMHQVRRNTNETLDDLSQPNNTCYSGVSPETTTNDVHLRVSSPTTLTSRGNPVTLENSPPGKPRIAVKFSYNLPTEEFHIHVQGITGLPLRYGILPPKFFFKIRLFNAEFTRFLPLPSRTYGSVLSRSDSICHHCFRQAGIVPGSSISTPGNEESCSECTTCLPVDTTESILGPYSSSSMLVPEQIIIVSRDRLRRIVMTIEVLDESCPTEAVLVRLIVPIWKHASRFLNRNKPPLQLISRMSMVTPPCKGKLKIEAKFDTHSNQLSFYITKIKHLQLGSNSNDEEWCGVTKSSLKFSITIVDNSTGKDVVTSSFRYAKESPVLPNTKQVNFPHSAKARLSSPQSGQTIDPNNGSEADIMKNRYTLVLKVYQESEMSLNMMVKSVDKFIGEAHVNKLNSQYSAIFSMPNEHFLFSLPLR